ncbi:DUF3231 family protein [Bacillus litorisediminis]|uniref:DUF3231 family protein n=1 Tax=Bacillus litorisediminis TaxID=2922713 RepID=UPI001FAD178E|nr:DUF3231 family protein [Bacillus litorisediminis]
MKDTIIELDIPNLWTPYMNNTLATCMNKYALRIIEDSDIQKIYEKSLELSTNNTRRITEIFSQVSFPIPHGFTDDDVDLDAPRLFSDEFLLFYLHEMTIYGLTAYSLGITTTHNPDVHQFFVNAYNGALELYETTLDTMKSSGLMERTPKYSIA